MMQQMQAMQRCMENIDQGEIQQLERESLQLQQQIQSLCKAGDKGKALDEAVSFSRRIANSNAVKQMNRCVDMAPITLPQMSLDNWTKMSKDIDICQYQN